MLSVACDITGDLPQLTINNKLSWLIRIMILSLSPGLTTVILQLLRRKMIGFHLGFSCWPARMGANKRGNDLVSLQESADFIQNGSPLENGRIFPDYLAGFTSTLTLNRTVHQNLLLSQIYISCSGADRVVKCLMPVLRCVEQSLQWQQESGNRK